MGIDYSGSMIVGEHGIVIKSNNKNINLYDLVDKHNLDVLHDFYDADYEDSFIGFIIKDIEVLKIDENWVKKIKDLAYKFEKITGVKAKLIGTQHIT